MATSSAGAAKRKTRVLLAVCGTKAARVVPTIVVPGLLTRGYEVKVICSQSSMNFMDKTMLEPSVLMERTRLESIDVSIYVDGDEWANDKFNNTPLYRRLTDWADVMLIAPMSANGMFKFAHGSTEGLLPSVFMTCIGDKKPIIAAPDMDDNWWRRQSTMANAAILRGYGVDIIEPTRGSGFMHMGFEKVDNRVKAAVRRPAANH